MVCHDMVWFDLLCVQLDLNSNLVTILAGWISVKIRLTVGTKLGNIAD